MRHIIGNKGRHIDWSYLVPNTKSAGPGHFNCPDDVHLLADNTVLSADIRNCRVMLIDPKSAQVLQQWVSALTVPPRSAALCGSAQRFIAARQRRCAGHRAWLMNLADHAGRQARFDRQGPARELPVGRAKMLTIRSAHHGVRVSLSRRHTASARPVRPMRTASRPPIESAVRRPTRAQVRSLRS